LLLISGDDKSNFEGINGAGLAFSWIGLIMYIATPWAVKVMGKLP